jgi:uncharacterized protein
MASITELKTPGVYIHEVATFPPSIAAVGTGIPAFIGYTQIAEDSLKRTLHNIPTRISSMNEYVTYFGGADVEPDGVLEVTIKEKVDKDDKSVSITSLTVVIDEVKRSNHIMYFSLQLYFANGGGPCYIISVGDYTKAEVSNGDTADPAKPGFLYGLAALRNEDEPTLIVIPEAKQLTESDFYVLQKASLTQCKELQDRFTIMDVFIAPTNENNLVQTEIDFRTGIGGNPLELRYGAAYFPDVETVFDFNYDEAKVNIKHLKTKINEDGTEVPEGNGDLNGTKINGKVKTDRSALYERIKLELKNHSMRLPVSSAIAGVYASVDRDRGVWKAPANVSLNAVVKPSIKISDEQQENMNVDASSGKSINAVRSFIGKGTLVWGARTLNGNDNEWRYIPVRRLFIMVEESVKKASFPFVFEPNDANTWVRVRAMIENFLTLLWRDGALAGTKPEQAFYVKVGLNQTMSSIDILEGRMIVEIGMAAVRPAEFIVLKFSHKMQES